MKNEQQSENLLLKVNPRSTFGNTWTFFNLQQTFFLRHNLITRGEERETTTQNLERNNVAGQVEGFRFPPTTPLLYPVMFD